MEVFQNFDMKKWALILGGSHGIGIASAKKLAEDGFDLVVLFRERKKEAREAEKHFEEIREMGGKCLIFNKDALKMEAQKEVGEVLRNEGIKISVLLHSIAKGNLKPMADFISKQTVYQYFEKANTELSEIYSQQKSFLKTQDFELTIQSMALSYFEWVRFLFEENLFAENANCIALTSEGSKKAWRNYAAVSAAKAALEAISRSVALEFAPHGICSNLIQAGITDTRSLQMIPGSKFLKEQAQFRNPFERLTKPEDVAEVVAFLASEKSKWVNGQILTVDGGESIS